jgi:hypothetical protein
MKANQFGTRTEQLMHRMGYLTISDRPKCLTCKHHEFIIRMPDTVYESSVYRCNKGDFAISKNSICNEHAAA